MTQEKSGATRKAKITDENREESRKLRALWAAWKKTERALSQAEFGERFDVGAQSYVGFCLNGKSAISLKAARGFARGLGCAIADFSPRLAREASDAGVLALPAPQISGSALSATPIRARLSIRDLVFQLRDAMLAVSPHQRNAVVSNLSALVECIEDVDQVSHIAGLVEMTLTRPTPVVQQVAINDT